MNPIIPIMAHLNIHEIVVKKIFISLEHKYCFFRMMYDTMTMDDNASLAFLVFFPVMTRPWMICPMDEGSLVTAPVTGQQTKRPCFQNILDNLSQTLKTYPCTSAPVMDLQNGIAQA
jgi:hypothetical protein